MASSITIQFDPDDLEAKHLLEKMAALMDRRTEALDQPDPYGAKPAPVAPLFVDDDDEEDDESDEEGDTRDLSFGEALVEIADYLGIKWTRSVEVVEAVKDLGSRLQDAKAGRAV